MPLGLTMHGKWDGISMASPSLHSYKHERPAYSTPQPVENTPANNECRMVELRGAKVASFFLGGDEFICLPQAFDLFLKHLVGGLHTVYTKLKRLSISPVVCNVEQVRILRGLGAIQPGVNRCKLITRKDFEILYQDCTQASRPGRPPKRYPMLPPTTDLASHYTGLRSMSAAHGMLAASDLNNLHKRMRLEHDAEKHLQQQQDRRMSDSPTKDTSALSTKDLSIPGGNDVHANAANLYMQAHQALRQQYQQVATSGLHNGIDPQQTVAAAGINPALAPLMMMSHPALFSGAFPPNVLNHINQFAQNHANGNAVTTAAAAAAAQIAANGGNMHQRAAAVYQVAAAAQSAAQASLAAAAASASNSAQDGEGPRSSSMHDGKASDGEEPHKGISIPNHVDASEIPDDGGSDGHESTSSSISSTIDGEDNMNGSLSGCSDGRDSVKLIAENEEGAHLTGQTEEKSYVMENPDQQENHSPNNGEEAEQGRSVSNEDPFVVEGVEGALTVPGNISSMQTLLTNIQGLLRVAADNARLQEKHSSFEIADLKNRMSMEREMRGTAEKKLRESERIRGLIQRRLKKERKVRKILQEQLLTMQQQLGQEDGEPVEKITAAPSIPITGVLGAGREIASNSPKQTSPKSAAEPRGLTPSPNSADVDHTSSAAPQTKSIIPTGECGSFSSTRTISINNSSNNNNKPVISFCEDAKMAQHGTQFPTGRLVCAENDSHISAANGSRIVDQAHVPGVHMFFNGGHFQTAATQ